MKGELMTTCPRCGIFTLYFVRIVCDPVLPSGWLWSCDNDFCAWQGDNDKAAASGVCKAAVAMAAELMANASC